MPKVVIALDFPEAAPALQLASKLKNQGLWMKVGLELFSRAGPDMIKALKDMDFPVFSTFLFAKIHISCLIIVKQLLKNLQNKPNYIKI